MEKKEILELSEEYSDLLESGSYINNLSEYRIKKSDGLLEFMVLQPLYLLNKEISLNNEFISLYEEYYKQDFINMDIVINELDIGFFCKLFNKIFLKEEIYCAIYNLFRLGSIGLYKYDEDIIFNNFNHGLKYYDFKKHVFNHKDRIYIKENGKITYNCLLNHSKNKLVKNFKDKNMKKGTYLDKDLGEVFSNGEKKGIIGIGTKEFIFFEYLYDNKGKKCSHDDIKKYINGKFIIEASSSSFCSNLKRRIEDKKIRSIIKTYTGGYIIKE